MNLSTFKVIIDNLACHVLRYINNIIYLIQGNIFLRQEYIIGMKLLKNLGGVL